MHQYVAGSISTQGTYLVAGSTPSRGMYRRQPIDVLLHVNVSLPLSLPPFLPCSLKSITMSLGEGFFFF